MISILHGVVTCVKDQQRGCNQAIRNTFLRRWPHAVKTVFMHGDPVPSPHFDEVSCDCPDDYGHLWQKANAIVRIAWQDCFDYLFMCDVDTYAYLPRVVAAAEDHQPDYTGWRCDEGHAAGGHGYLLSRNALRWLVADPSKGGHFDMWVGEVMRKNNIPLRDNRLFLPSVPKTWTKGGITAHLGGVVGTGAYKPSLMYEADAIDDI